MNTDKDIKPLAASVTERMCGCRDDKESVICPKCKGRFK